MRGSFDRVHLAATVAATAAYAQARLVAGSVWLVGESGERQDVGDDHQWSWNADDAAADHEDTRAIDDVGFECARHVVEIAV
jgi:hypothetical protein